MKEIELKFAVADHVLLRERLDALGATVEASPEAHEDIYFRHPCRDFRETDEALRIRFLNGQPLVTYKGPREPAEQLAVNAGVKVRRELEWPLGPSDPRGESMQALFVALGFSEVARVVKRREVLQVPFGGRQVTVAIDQVDNLGWYAEVEVLIELDSERAAMVDVISRLADALGLRDAERRSYLELLLRTLGRET
jgi:adenylate cyclase class 2